MDFSIETGDLQKAIKLLGVTAKVNTKDSTGMVLIATEEDGTVTFLANNNSTALTYNSKKALINTPGAVAIEFAKIRSFVSSFPAWKENAGVKDFHFSADDRKLSINVVNHYESGKISKGNLNLSTYDVYSVRAPKPFGEPNFILNSTVFRGATSKVLYAIDPSEAKPFIQGMNVNFDDDSIYFVGTNGKLLSEYKVKNISALKEGSFLLRYDFIMGLRRALGEETDIYFEFEERDVKARFDDVCFWGKTIIGHEYPDYKPILDVFEHEITLDKDVLMSSLLPFSDILNPDDNYRLTFKLANGNMELVNDAANFVYDEEVEYKDDFVIDVNGLYMIQTIDVIKDDKITVKFSEDKKPLIFDAGNFQDQKALITPLRRR